MESQRERVREKERQTEKSKGIGKEKKISYQEFLQIGFNGHFFLGRIVKIGHAVGS